jgi:hypothetical protein
LASDLDFWNCDSHRSSSTDSTQVKSQQLLGVVDTSNQHGRLSITRVRASQEGNFAQLRVPRLLQERQPSLRGPKFCASLPLRSPFSKNLGVPPGVKSKERTRRICDKEAKKKTSLIKSRFGNLVDKFAPLEERLSDAVHASTKKEDLQQRGLGFSFCEHG